MRSSGGGGSRGGGGGVGGLENEVLGGLVEGGVAFAKLKVVAY